MILKVLTYLLKIATFKIENSLRNLISSSVPRFRRT